MSRRVFVNVRRGPMDNTAVCVYPWEVPLLQHVHLNNVEEVSIEAMANQKDGVVKVERLKLKHTDKPAPDLRAQLEAMAYVDPEDDPANDPAAEFNRLAEKYGMDRDFPMPVVERIYGSYQEGGAFEAKLREHAKERIPKPAHLRAADEGMTKSPKDMTVGELRKELTARGLKWTPKEGQAVLAARLESNFAEAA